MRSIDREPVGRRVTPQAYGRTMNESLHSTHPGGQPDGQPGSSAGAPAPQPPLPFRDEAEAPIAYELTARARRTVAPASLPPLVVVPDTDLERPGDTRPARARALRRAGTSVAKIARQLQVDELAVHAWVADVDARAHHRRAARPPTPRPTVSVRPAPSAVSALPAPAGAPVVLSDQEHAHAVAEARARLLDDVELAAGVGLLVALTQDDAHAVTFTTEDLRVARRLVRWLRRDGGLARSDVRVALRLGPTVAGDVARHRWASELDISLDHVAHTRWRTAPDPGAIEAIVRLPDPRLASQLAVWRVALLEPESAADDF